MLPAGTIIGTYRVLGKIGEGGMGTVYLGEHTLLGRRAAIKVLLPELSANHGDRAALLQRGARGHPDRRSGHRPGVRLRLSHRRQRVHRDGAARRRADGQAPRARRPDQRRRDTAPDAAAYARRSAPRTRKGIVHRDLKPENIFIVGDPAVTGGERPKILDFGIAKLSSDEPGTHQDAHRHA